MDKTKVFTIVFFVLAVFLSGYLVYIIRDSINEREVIERKEARIIEQLKMIREAEVAFLAVNGRYTNSWTELTSFIDTGRFYIVEKKEEVFQLAYGADSVRVSIDTLGTFPVKDSLFTKERWPRFDLERFAYVPVLKNTKFEIWVDKKEKSGVTVNLIEVRNPKPINPARSLTSDLKTRRSLHFGSQSSVTTTGNWE